MCQFTEPWLAKEIAGVTDCKNKEHVFNAGIFFSSSSLPDMAGKELGAAAAEERSHTQPVAGGSPSLGDSLVPKDVISAITSGPWVTG